MSIISNKLKLALFLLLFSGLSFAQGSIYINGTQSATGASTAASSINGAVDTFMLQYYTTGTPATLSIQIEGDNGSGSFVLCGSAITTTTSGQTKCTGNYKQVRYNLTGLTGGTAPTVTASLIGNSSGDEPGGTAAAQVQGPDANGTTTANILGNPILMGAWNGATLQRFVCAGSGGGAQCGVFNIATLADGNTNAGGAVPYNPGNGGVLLAGLSIAPNWFNGATWDRQITCSNTTPFSVASTITQVVALSASTKIRVCGVSFFPTTSTAGSVDLVYGTGSNCATGTTTLTGAVTLPASAVTHITIPITPNGPLTTPAAQALCVRTVTSTVAGYVSWEQH